MKVDYEAAIKRPDFLDGYLCRRAGRDSWRMEWSRRSCFARRRYRDARWRNLEVIGSLNRNPSRSSHPDHEQKTMVYIGSIVRNRPKKRPSMTGTRRRLFTEHGALCAYCRRQTEMPSLLPGNHHDLIATVEHIIPVSRGGNMKGDNLTLACSLCNGLKGDMTPHQWAEFMMSNPRWWEKHQRKYRRPKVARLFDREYTLRPLKKGEPIPIRYDDPYAQAAFEGAYRGREYLLRVEVAPDEP